jgi:hypothetical protein
MLRVQRPQSLGVHLTLVPSLGTPSAKAEAIVGWTGMASASSLKQLNLSSDLGMETIEIDPQYAQGLGFSEGDTVEIGLLHDLPLAKSVAAEPFAPDDWEIIVNSTQFRCHHVLNPLCNLGNSCISYRIDPSIPSTCRPDWPRN